MYYAIATKEVKKAELRIAITEGEIGSLHNGTRITGVTFVNGMKLTIHLYRNDEAPFVVKKVKKKGKRK